jgi:predicted nucleotidyltransferase
MGILERLFSSHALVKILKLFYLNPGKVFPPRDIAIRTHSKPEMVRQELRILNSIGFIKQTTQTLEEPSPEKENKPRKKRITGYVLDQSFQLLSELRDLVLTVAPVSKHELAKRLRRVGRVKLVVLSGIFLKREDSRVDMLIVGDNLKKGQLDMTLRSVEAEVGKELAYAILDTGDFKYRLGMNDKFVRDIFDYSHEIVIDKIGVVR